MAMSRETLSLVVLLLQAWLIFFPVILTPANGLHYHQRAGQKPASDNNPGFISIDCGATEDYYDESTGIFYKTDAEFIDTGKNVKLPAISDKLPKQVYNLRIFPDGAKNCYTLKPEKGKNNKYLVRASFRYGNYDGKNKAPVFDLYLGVNFWDTVEVQDSNFTYIWSEIIHVPTTDNINVCLVNKDSGIPYISILELRLLNSSIYPIESGALATKWRYDVGGTSDVRYGDDVYDRIWNPLRLPDPSGYWLPSYLNTTISIQSSNGAYFPPGGVLRTAALGYNATMCLRYSWNTVHASTEHYVYLYFTEIEDLKDGQLRRVVISLNGVNPLTNPIELEYLKPLNIDFPKFPIKGDRVYFSICSTTDSKLPPILNAFEVFTLTPLPESPTEPEDVNAVMDIKQAYGMSRNWQGDPCVPSNFSWDGLTCSYNNIARIISLNLSSSKLTGEIVQSLSNLKAIQNMDLSNNYLTGPLPEFLVQLPSLTVLDLSNNDLNGPVPDFVANFPSLRTLNLSGNKLRGSIPQAVMKAMDDGLLNLRNPDLCLSAPCKPKENNFIVPVVASITSVLVVLLIALALWWKCRRQGDMSIGSRRSLMSKNQAFTYSEIVSITDNFRTVIGEGGFGKVYLGTLKNGDRVAVKLRSSSSKQGLKEFRSEALLLLRVHHGNLVSLIGFCDDGKNMVLVYEYMPNGDLRQHLSETSSNVLNWSERLQVARDAAQVLEGLEYLHNGCKPPIIHRDVKTANILLNKDYQGKIADFGLSRDSVEVDTHTTNPAGTFAYMDPEYISSRKLNKKSDVYSFGIVLLELITGQPALIRSPDMIHIVHWIRPFIERGDIRSIVDPRLQGEFNPNSAWKAVEVAMSCIPPTAIQRPEMSDILSELKECLEIEMGRHRSWSRKSNERSLSSSLELATMDLDTADITIPSAR